jgi:hypothetical protein
VQEWLHDWRAAGGDARSGDIINRMRAPIKNTAPRKDRIDLNEAVTEVIALARGAIAENGISIHTCLWESLLAVQGGDAEAEPPARPSQIPSDRIGQ